ncbi:MAG: hypothetical protein B6D73_06640 [gamma proteobacterium symbiont of Stewartia floridana]|nr:MAG: hypothetical protein B6D73_06640 [gamma proteobacterium symbiont of Stewartia floridana]
MYHPPVIVACLQALGLVYPAAVDLPHWVATRSALEKPDITGSPANTLTHPDFLFSTACPAN